MKKLLLLLILNIFSQLNCSDIKLASTTEVRQKVTYTKEAYIKSFIVPAIKNIFQNYSSYDGIDQFLGLRICLEEKLNLFKFINGKQPKKFLLTGEVPYLSEEEIKEEIDKTCKKTQIGKSGMEILQKIEKSFNYESAKKAISGLTIPQYLEMVYQTVIDHLASGAI